MGMTSYQSPPTSTPTPAGLVARRDVPPVDGRDGVGQQVPLQFVRDPALAVEGPGPDHDGADLLGQLLGQSEIPLGEAATRAGGDQGDGAEDLLVAQAERHGHVRGEPERLEDGVVALVTARRTQEVVGHVGAPHRPAAAHDLHGGMGTLGIGWVRAAQLLGECPLVRVGVPGSHPPHLAVLVHDVDEADVGHDRDRDLGQTLHHLSVVDDLGQDLGRQKEELVAAPDLEELLDQLLPFGRLGGCVEELAELIADHVHQLDDRGVALALVTAQHLDDPDAGAVVADREGVRALQTVLPERVGHEALVADEVGYPQWFAMIDDPSGETFAPTGGIGRLLLREGGRHGGRARPHVPTDQFLIGRDGPERGHVPVEAPAEGREDAVRPEVRRSGRRRGSRATRSSAPTSAAASSRPGPGGCRRQPGRRAGGRRC